MFDSLPYRNDAAIVFRRLIRSLPTPRGRDRRGDVRQRFARDDDGAGRACTICPAMIVPGGVTLPPSERRRRRRGADDRRALRARNAHARGSGRSRLPRVRFAGRRLPVSRHGGDLAGRGRSARHGAAALGARAVGPAGLARHRRALGARVVRTGTARNQDARHPHRRSDSQCDGRPRGVRRLDESAAAHSRHRPRRGACAADGAKIGSTINRRVPRLVDVLAERPGASSDRARLPRRRRAGSDAAPARAWAARTRAC